MDGVGAAASGLALVEVSVKVLSLPVKSAKEDIPRFHFELETLIKFLRSLHELAQEFRGHNICYIQI